jgi:GxxExxY protein
MTRDSGPAMGDERLLEKLHESNDRQDGHDGQDVHDVRLTRRPNSLLARCSLSAEVDDPLTRLIIGLAMKVHTTLGPGFLESVYRNALVFELRRSGLSCEVEKRIKVLDEAVVVGDYVPDILINDRVLIELKAIEALSIISASGLRRSRGYECMGEDLDVRRQYEPFESTAACTGTRHRARREPAEQHATRSSRENAELFEVPELRAALCPVQQIRIIFIVFIIFIM